MRGLKRESELLGISVKAFGERDAFLRVIATALGIDLDYFIDYEARRRIRRNALIASFAAILTVFAGVLAWYNTPHSRYYRSYVYKWEKNCRTIRG